MGGQQAESTNRGEGRVYVTYIHLRKQVTFTFGYVLPYEFHSTSVHVTKHFVAICSPQEIIFHPYYYTGLFS